MGDDTHRDTHRITVERTESGNFYRATWKFGNQSADDLGATPAEALSRLAELIEGIYLNLAEEKMLGLLVGDGA
jgi:hypothetical protein